MYFYNSLAPERCDYNLKSVIFETHFKVLSTSCEIGLFTVSATEHFRWQVSIGSGNGLVFQYRSILDWIYKEPGVKLKKLVLIFSTYNKKFDKLKVIHTNLNASLN